MNKKIIIKNMDDYTGNPYSIDEYIDTLSKWNKKYEHEENWDFIQKYLFEGMYNSLGEILRDNYAYFSVSPEDKKFAYSFEFENSYQFKYGLGNDKFNLENLLKTLAGFGIFQVLNFNGNKCLIILDTAIRPDLQQQQIFQNCLTELLSNTNKYFGCEPDYVFVNIHNDNQPSKNAFAKFGIDEKSNLIQNKPKNSVSQYQVEFKTIKKAVEKLQSQQAEPENN